jgi:hypothetical protein
MPELSTEVSMDIPEFKPDKLRVLLPVPFAAENTFD